MPRSRVRESSAAKPSRLRYPIRADDNRGFDDCSTFTFNACNRHGDIAGFDRDSDGSAVTFDRLNRAAQCLLVDSTRCTHNFSGPDPDSGNDARS